MSDFPELIKKLRAFEGPFDAHQLDATGCKILFASYPVGTQIDMHSHETENCGVITRGELLLHTKTGERCYGPGD